MHPIIVPAGNYELRIEILNAGLNKLDCLTVTTAPVTQAPEPALAERSWGGIKAGFLGN